MISLDKNVFYTLQILTDDITKNQSQFKEPNLVKAIVEFQKKVLASRKIDPEIRAKLMKLTTKEINEVCKKLNIILLSSQTNKTTLANLTTSLIQQTKKKDEFIRLPKISHIPKRNPP